MILSTFSARFQPRCTRMYPTRPGGIMTADRVEVSLDPGKSKWLVRIQSGEEVLRRYCSASKNADEQALRAAAEQTVRDEGYQLAPSGVTIRRESAATR